MLYKRRFGPYFMNTLIAGIDPTTNEPFITASDPVGNMTECEDFACVGSGDDFALASCESKVF